MEIKKESKKELKKEIRKDMKREMKKNQKQQVNAKIAASSFISGLCRLIVRCSRQQQRSSSNDNRVLRISCENLNAEPSSIAKTYNRFISYGSIDRKEITGQDVVDIFRKFGLRHGPSRKKLFAEINQISTLLANIIDEEALLEQLSEVVPITDDHPQKKGLLLIMTAYNSKILKKSDAYSHTMRMNKDFGAECFDEMIEYMLAKSSKTPKLPVKEQLPIEEYQRKLNNLELELKRTNNLLQRLQDSFDEQLEASKLDERIRLISMLNSDKYGFILDLLLSAQKGFRSLRKQKVDLPFEIKDVQTLVRRLLEFTEDCQVSPMIEMGSVMEVKPLDIEGYSFEGTPFINEEEVKNVEVISTGWQIESQDIVISYPRVKEVAQTTEV